MKKILKNDLLKEMTSANLVKAADYEALSQQIIVDLTRNEKVNTLNGKLVLYNHFSVGKSRQGKVFSTSSNTRKLISISKTISKTTRLTADQESTTENDDVTESEKARRTNYIMSSLPTEFTDNIEDDIINHIEEVSSSDLTLDNAGHVTSSGSDETDMNIEGLFSEDSDANLMEIRVLYDGKEIGIEDEQNNQSMEIQSEQNRHRERNVELISELDIGEMLKAIQNEAKINKSWNMSVEDFKSKFCDAKSIDNTSQKLS